MEPSYLNTAQQNFALATEKALQCVSYATEVGTQVATNVKDAASFLFCPKNGYVGAGSFASSTWVNYYATLYGPQVLAKSWQNSVVNTLSPYISTPLAKGVAFLTTPKAVTTLSPAVTAAATVVAAAAAVAIGNAISSYFWG